MTARSEDPHADRVAACLLGGAVGDALGAGVEFDSVESIRRKYGGPVTGYVDAYGRRGAVTDDTQMTLFAVEGLVNGLATGRATACVRESYLRWLSGQRDGVLPDGGWLPPDPLLTASRAPGNTCLSGLSAGAGTTQRPVNAHSKGCGTVMRAAPYGLLRGLALAERCRLAVDDAALTHGHPTAWAASAALTCILSALTEGASLEQAIDAAVHAPDLLGPGADEQIEGLQLALTEPAAASVPSVLGEGWVGDEALRIALWCALKAPDPASALLLAVNHDGDSDSTGSLCGQVLGVAGGRAFLDALPAGWISDNEATDLLGVVVPRFSELA